MTAPLARILHSRVWTRFWLPTYSRRNAELTSLGKYPASFSHCASRETDLSSFLSWDQEFEVAWGSGCHKYGASGLLMRLLTAQRRHKNKIVVLTHDFFYFGKDRRSPGCKKYNLVQLKLFIKWAKRLGYKFRWLDYQQFCILHYCIV